MIDDEMNESEFWSATDQLNLIHQWARASYVAPWGLLFAVFLRVSASTSHGVMLPGPPAPASLNQGVVFIGRSGAGKGVTDKLGRVVWPADIHEEGLGSGQGIAELFKEQKNPEDRITRALITVSEIDHLTALNAGQGNNTRAALKAALTGDRLGSKGASTATSRAVPADSYRLSLSLSAQFGHTAVLMDDVSGGTPQRMLWAPVTDPEMPETPGPTPDRVLDTELPPWALSDRPVLLQYGSPEIREYVKAGLLANGRGEGDAIDGHHTLTRLKVSADLAILDHRSVISELDWHLSEVIMAKSDATRNAVIEYDRQAARAKIRDRAVTRAAGEEFYDASRLETVKRSILRMLERDGEQAGGDLRRRLGKREKRELFDQAIDLLQNAGMVTASPGEHNSVRYRIGSPVTKEVTPQNTSSAGVTNEVTRDHPDNVTNLDFRRSATDWVTKPSAREWFETYIAGLQAAGRTTITSNEAMDAGVAAGYTKGNIRAARSCHPDVTTVDRRGQGGAATWSIVPGAEPPKYISDAQWLDDYLDRQTANEIDPNDVKAAADADGHPWHGVRRAAGLSPRVNSVPAHGDARTERIWQIVDTEKAAGA